MWDYFGLRPWILKYTPREGKILEAGCGLGRYVFYLSTFGLDIEGLDFSEETVQFLNEWKKENGFNDLIFKTGNVLNLPYEHTSLSGYLSFGVLEHFIEGPYKALAEVKRVLRPGGIAVISTPSVSFNIRLCRVKQGIKNIVKKTIFYPINKPEFFQYWFKAKQLKKYMTQSGLTVTRFDNAALLYAFLEYNNFNIKRIKPKTFAYWFAERFENTYFKKMGAQSITIAVKTAEKMHCFICGAKEASLDSLKEYDVPICPDCRNSSVALFYKRGVKVRFDGSYIIEPPLAVQQLTCDFCNKNFTTSKIFENYGFSKNVCPSCLRDKRINITLSNKYVKPVYRSRKSNKSIESL